MKQTLLILFIMSASMAFAQNKRRILGCWSVYEKGSKVQWQFEKDSIRYIIVTYEGNTKEVWDVTVLDGTYKLLKDTVFAILGPNKVPLNIPVISTKKNKLVLGEKNSQQILTRTNLCLRYRLITSDDGGYHWELVD
ncbi:MAG: hypothetical protein ACKOXB_15740 [Flavobacteriales bacterium]